MCMLFTGCTNNKYQQDESYETDIVGLYSTQGCSTEMKFLK